MGADAMSPAPPMSKIDLSLRSQQLDYDSPSRLNFNFLNRSKEKPLDSAELEHFSLVVGVGPANNAKPSQLRNATPETHAFCVPNYVKGPPPALPPKSDEVKHGPKKVIKKWSDFSVEETSDADDDSVPGKLRRFIARSWARYLQLLDERPLHTKTWTAAYCGVASEIIVSRIADDG